MVMKLTKTQYPSIQNSQVGTGSDNLPIKEDLLQYIWKMKAIPSTRINTSTGSGLEILNFGTLNFDQGPDFLNARIQLDGLEFAGSIEIHIKSSHWHRHKHEESKLYDNVILHVVYENDRQICNSAGEPIPTVELKNMLPQALLSSYRDFMRSGREIPCHNNLHEIDTITLRAMKDRMFAERLDRKTQEILEHLKINEFDWEELLYHYLFRYSAMGVNSEMFYDLAHSIPFFEIRKLRSDVFAIEALFFGQANLLTTDSSDCSYMLELKGEYEYQLKKLRLTHNYFQMKFSRMRPANFPTVRLAQLAALYANRTNLFRALLECSSARQVIDLLRVAPSGYWSCHYNFGRKSAVKNHGFGISLIRSLIVNVVVPMQYSYGRFHDNQHFIDNAQVLLETVPAEQNRITRKWVEYGLKASNAAESQALIQLFNQYCSHKKCLNCTFSSKTFLKQ